MCIARTWPARIPRGACTRMWARRSAHPAWLHRARAGEDTRRPLAHPGRPRQTAVPRPACGGRHNALAHRALHPHNSCARGVRMPATQGWRHRLTRLHCAHAAHYWAPASVRAPDGPHHCGRPCGWATCAVMCASTMRCRPMATGGARDAPPKCGGAEASLPAGGRRRSVWQHDHDHA